MNSMYDDYEFENRINNLAWTISGNYNEDINISKENYISKDVAMYFAIMEGARHKYIDWNVIKKYIISRVKSGYDLEIISNLAHIVFNRIIEEKVINERPGVEDIIKQAIENNIEIEVLPGATASITALVGSGLETGKFAFEVFLDRDKKVRRNQLEEIKEERRTIIFYESPHRLKDTLKDMLKILGNRSISINRELTKKYQEIIRNDIQGCIDIFNEREVKGEFVLIVEGFKGEVEQVCEYDHLNERDYVLKLIEEGITKKDAIKIVCKERKLKKDVVYKQVLDL